MAFDWLTAKVVDPAASNSAPEGGRKTHQLEADATGLAKGDAGNSAPARPDDWTVGWGTKFGYKDPEDNGEGAWGTPTNNPDVVGVSLPRQTLRDLFGDEDKAEGAMVEVRNPVTGQTIQAPILDKGPGRRVIARQGPTIDLTHAANLALGGSGKTPMEWRVIGQGAASGEQGGSGVEDRVNVPELDAGQQGAGSGEQGVAQEPPTPPAVGFDGRPQQVWRSFNGVPDRVAPADVNWQGSPVVVENTVPRAQAAGFDWATAKVVKDDVEKGFDWATAKVVQEPGVFDAWKNAALRGWNMAEEAMAVQRGDAAGVAENSREMAEAPASPEYISMMDDRTGWRGAWEGFKAAPVQVIGEGLIESGAAYMRALADKSNTIAQAQVAGTMLGAAVGAPGGVTAVPGAVVGFGAGTTAGMTAATFEASTMLEYGSSLVESMQEAGIDVNNPESVRAAFSDVEKMKGWAQRANAKSVPIGVFDAASAGIAGRLFPKPARKIAGKVAQWLAELTAQAGLGAGGEAAGQVAADGKITSWKSIAAEAALELPGGAVEIATGSAAHALEKAGGGRLNAEVPEAGADPGGLDGVRVDAPGLSAEEEALFGQEDAAGLNPDARFAPRDEEGASTFAEPAAEEPAGQGNARAASAEAVAGGEAAVLTPEADELISQMDNGAAAPAFISRNLERIAAENGVAVAGDMTPDDVIASLRNKRFQPSQGGFINTEILAELVDYGRTIFRAGMDFVQWAGQMVRRFGEQVTPYLRKVFETINGGSWNENISGSVLAGDENISGSVLTGAGEESDGAEFMPGARMTLDEFKRTASKEDVRAVNDGIKLIAEKAKNNPEAVRLRMKTNKDGSPKIDIKEDADGVAVLDEQGRQQRSVQFMGEPNKLRQAPGLSKKEATAVRQASDRLEADARQALADPASAKGQGWYARMRHFLQKQLGANIEMFGQLLGATSARTPVDQNFKQALEGLREFSTGKYDALLGRYHAWVLDARRMAESGELFAEWRARYPNKRDAEFNLEDRLRIRINAFPEVPLRSNGRKFNANSMKVLQSFYGNWLAQTVGPKTPNFAGNLTGRTLKATIDVWAARNLRRLLYKGKVSRWRILPEQDTGVTDVDFAFAQAVFDEVGRRLGMAPDDLQALMWFWEKGVWDSNGWTNVVGGEKSSFDKEAGNLEMDRYQAGLTTFTTKDQFDEKVQEKERVSLRGVISKVKGLVASRVTHSDGLYGVAAELSFDVEFSVQRVGGQSPSITDVVQEILRIAAGQKNRQTDTFISVVVDANHANARPMIEVGFKSPATAEDVAQVVKMFQAQGIDGFTVAKDDRGNVIGIRAQYIPEYSARYDSADHLDPSKFVANSVKWVQNVTVVASQAGALENVSYVEPGHVSTIVYGTEEYSTASPGDLRASNATAELGRRKAILAANEGSLPGGPDSLAEAGSDGEGYRAAGGNVPDSGSAAAVTASNETSQEAEEFLSESRLTREQLERKAKAEKVLSRKGYKLAAQTGEVGTFWRNGAPPESGYSYNFKDKFSEAGVSVYPTPEAASFAGLTARDWYRIQGEVVGRGSDGEPVVKVLKSVKLSKDQLAADQSLLSDLQPLQKLFVGDWVKHTGINGAERELLIIKVEDYGVSEGISIHQLSTAPSDVRRQYIFRDDGFTEILGNAHGFKLPDYYRGDQRAEKFLNNLRRLIPDTRAPSSGALRSKLNNSEGGFINTEILSEVVDYGRTIVRAGMDFVQWSAQMVRDLGDGVRAVLRKVWDTINGGQLLPSARQAGAVRVPERDRGFVESARAADAVVPDVKQMLAGVYDPLSNAVTVEAARVWINGQGLDRSLAALLGNDAPTARDYAAGIELISRLQAAGRLEDAAMLIEGMAEKATTQGQAIQALSLLSRLSADGIQVYAHRVISKAVKKGSPKLRKLQEEIAKLRAELRKVREVLAKVAVAQAKVPGSKETVQARIRRLLVANPGSVWGRYKAQAVRELAGKLLGGAGPRGIPALEAFTARLKKQLRERLPVRAAGAVAEVPGLAEAEMIGEAVRNFDKYKAVWTEAQAYVMDLYRDNPEALQSLDSFLGQILDRPFSPKSVDRAVLETLVGLNTSMKDVLVSSQESKAKTRAELERVILERAGLSRAQAMGLAEAVQAAFDAQQQAARGQLLRQMTALRGSDKVKKSKLQRLMELNNAGALDDGAFFGALAKFYGIPAWTPALAERVKRLQADYERAKDPQLKLAKGAMMFDAIHEMIPAEVFTKVRALQNIALLLNPKTIIRNVAGNLAMFVADVAADAVTMTVVDPFVSIFTGLRTRRSVDVAARLSGLVQPVRDYWHGYEFAREGGATVAASMAEGVNTLLTLGRLSNRGKWDIGQINKGSSRVLTSRAGRMLEDTLSVVLGVPDRAFHQAAFHASMARQMRLAAAAGPVVAPTPAMMEEAMMDAARAVFQDENFVSTALRKIGRALNLASTLGFSENYGLGAVVIPFAQVPGSIVVRGVEWSPLGFIRASYELVRPTLKRDGFRQREFVDAFSRAALGTGIATLGVYLFKMGIITALREEDDDLDAMREASGWGKFVVNCSALKRVMMTGNWWTAQKPMAGDVTVNYDWVQPNAMALAMGAEMAHKQEQRARTATATGQPVPGALLDNLAAAGKAAVMTLESQPLLVGISRLAGDVGRDGMAAGLAKQALSAPGMFVPTFVGQVNQLMDNAVRETRAGGLMDQTVARIEARIPGLSQKYPPRYDVMGEAQVRYKYGGNSLLNVLVNPAWIGQVKAHPALQEAERVFAATGEKGVLLRKAEVKLSAAGQRVELTNEQISQYQREMGTLTVKLYTRLAASPQFAAAPMGAKAAVLAQAVALAHDATKLRVLAGNPDLVERVRAQNAQKAQAARAAMSVH